VTSLDTYPAMSAVCVFIVGTVKGTGAEKMNGKLTFTSPVKGVPIAFCIASAVGTT